MRLARHVHVRAPHPETQTQTQTQTGAQDLTQELLKLSVLYTALELSDKVGGLCRKGCHCGTPRCFRFFRLCTAKACGLSPSRPRPAPPPSLASAPCAPLIKPLTKTLPQICCSFGVDVLEALAASCTQLAAAWTPRAAFNLACDVTVASLLLVLHGATLMSQVGAEGWGAAVGGRRRQRGCLAAGRDARAVQGGLGDGTWVPARLLFLACEQQGVAPFITPFTSSLRCLPPASLPGHGVWRGHEQPQEHAGRAAHRRQLHRDQGWA